MRKSNTDLVFLFPIVPLAIGISSQLTLNYPNMTYTKCIALTIVYGVMLYAAFFFGCFGFSSLIKSIFCKIKGYSFFPLLIYPIYVYYNGTKLNVRFVFEWSSMFRDMYPKDLLCNYCNESKEIERIFMQILKIKVISKFLYLISLSVVCFILTNNWGILLFGIQLIASFVFLCRLQTSYFHGDITKINNIKCGNLVIYLAKEICIYEIEKKVKKQIYSDFNKWLSNVKDCDKYINFIATTIKHMLVEEYASQDSYVAPNTIMIAKEKIINRDEIKMGFLDESWELLKIYLAYSVIKNNKEELTYLITELRFLKINLSFYVEKFVKMMDWYIAIANLSVKSDEHKEYPFLVSKDRFCDIAINYKNNLIQMEQETWSNIEGARNIADNSRY